MRPGWKWIAAMSVLVLGIVVSVSGAATSGSKRDGGSGSSTQSEKRQGEKRLHVIGPPGEHLSTLADELGVTQAKLRDALEAVREDLEPPERPRQGPAADEGADGEALQRAHRRAREGARQER